MIYTILDINSKTSYDKFTASIDLMFEDTRIELNNIIDTYVSLSESTFSINESIDFKSIIKSAIKFLGKLLEWLANKIVEIARYIKNKGYYLANKAYIHSMKKLFNITGPLNEATSSQVKIDTVKIIDPIEVEFKVMVSKTNSERKGQDPETYINYLDDVKNNYYNLVMGYGNEYYPEFPVVIVKPKPINTIKQKLSQLNSINNNLKNSMDTIPKIIIKYKATSISHAEKRLENDNDEFHYNNIYDSSSRANTYLKKALNDFLKEVQDCIKSQQDAIAKIRGNIDSIAKNRFGEYFDKLNEPNDKLFNKEKYEKYLKDKNNPS